MPDRSFPWFGGAWVGVFHFALQPVSPNILVPTPEGNRTRSADRRVLGRSDFGWVGKAYKPVPATIACWRRIEQFIYGAATPIDPFGSLKPTYDPTPASVAGNRDYVALPGALAEMRSGTPWYPYPFRTDRVAVSS